MAAIQHAIQHAIARVQQCLESPLISLPFPAELQTLGEQKQAAARAACETELVRLDAALEEPGTSIDLSFDTDALLAPLATLHNPDLVANILALDPKTFLRAASSGDVFIVDTMLNLGFFPVVDAFRAACRNGWIHVVRRLLVADDSLFRRPLCELYLHDALCHADILRELLPLYCLGPHEWLALSGELLNSCVMDNHIESARVLFECDPLVRIDTFHHAVREGLVEIVELLMSKVEIRNLYIYTGFRQACALGRENIVRLMFPFLRDDEFGRDVFKGRVLDSLAHAIRCKQARIVRLLLLQCRRESITLTQEFLASWCLFLTTRTSAQDVHVLRAIIEENPWFDPSVNRNKILYAVRSGMMYCRDSASEKFLQKLVADPRVVAARAAAFPVKAPVKAAKVAKAPVKAAKAAKAPAKASVKAAKAAKAPAKAPVAHTYNLRSRS